MFIMTISYVKDESLEILIKPKVRHLLLYLFSVKMSFYSFIFYIVNETLSLYYYHLIV